MIRRIIRLSVVQTGKFLAVFYGLFSLVFLPFLLVAMLAGGAKAVAPMLGMLLLYPVMGFLGGILMAAVYNRSAKWVGGLEVTVEAVDE